MARTIRRTVTQRLIAAIGFALLATVEITDPARLQSAEAVQPGRFEILAEFEGVAVRDRQTELVWERHPSGPSMSWSNAPMHCALKSIGGRSGWRLPSFLELMTLVQPSLDVNSTSLSLPAGHPFRGVQAASYWTSTPVDSDARQAYSVDFIAGDLDIRFKNQVHLTWCVRAGVSPSQHRDPFSRHRESV
jgi:uncharacterized protein DUF1566